jgi:hypothetical protein
MAVDIPWTFLLRHDDMYEWAGLFGLFWAFTVRIWTALFGSDGLLAAAGYWDTASALFRLFANGTIGVLRVESDYRSELQIVLM